MDLTYAFENAFPTDVLNRYTWIETRNAAAVLAASNPEQFADLLEVLLEFSIYDSDILVAGGNRGQIAIRLDSAFEAAGWNAVRINTEYRLNGKKKSAKFGRHYDLDFLEAEVRNEGFEVDNMKGRVAIDVEWNAKDGNLDRDLAAYRSLYELGLIDVACIITRDHQGIRDLAGNELKSDDAHRRLGTTTTTNMSKLQPRLTRGDAGGCPLLGIGITRATWAGAGKAAPHVELDADLAALVANEQDIDPDLE
jgi:hypothetical protein